MTQDERWQTRYDEVVSFIETNHRNPIPEQVLASFQWQATRSSAPTRSLSKHRIEEHNMLNWLKANRKALNAGKMKAERVEKLTIVDFRHSTRQCSSELGIVLAVPKV